MKEKSAERFLGLTVEAVENIYSNVRIVARDDEFYSITMDYLPDRLNLELEDGIVTVAYWG